MNYTSCVRVTPQNEFFPSVYDNQNEERTEYLWKIENFSMCPQRNGESLQSSEFSVDFMNELKLRLKLYPRGRNGTESENVSCYLESLSEFEYHINATVSFMANTGSTFFTKTKDFRIIKGSKIGFVLSYSRQDLFTKKPMHLPHDILTVHCIVKPFYNSSFSCDTDLFALSRDLSKIFNSRIYSDLKICSFGHKFSVHKFILAARAPYLAKYMGIIDDTTIQAVSLNTISIPTLQPLLSYLYSGELQEDLSPMVLDELYMVAETYNIDHLKSEILPAETSTLAFTLINTHCKLISYTIENFGERMIRGDWPVHTFVDLTIGKFIIAISMKRDFSSNCIEISIQNKSILITAGCIFLKCKVFLNKGHGDNNPELCAGIHWFEQQEEKSHLEFTMIGDTGALFLRNTLNEYPDALELAFDFSVSHPESGAESQPEEITTTLTTPRPSFRRSYQRLSADMDLVWRNTCLNSNYNENNSMLNFTDINLGFKSSKIQSHKAILAARSKTLYEILALNMPENDHYLAFDDFNEEVLCDLFRYMYSGKVRENVSDGNEALYDAAVKYGIQSLMKKCSK